MITYAYERVSSKDQNLERQETAIRKFRPDIPDANIFRDKVPGKTFDEMDRLGRDKESIKKELQWYKEHGIYTRILELPSTLVDIEPANKWVMDMVTNILIEVYATIAHEVVN